MRLFVIVMSFMVSQLAIAQTLAPPPTLSPTFGLQSLVDEASVIRVSNEVDIAVDAKDWTKARALFADDIKADFSTLTGKPAGQVKTDDLIKEWSTNLGPRKASFHLRGNHLVTLNNDKAIVLSHAYSWNKMEGHGDPLWEVWGNYTYEMARMTGGWKITSFTFVKTAERGNMWVKETPSPMQ